MTTDTTYNGWKNYETWAVKLWLDNDQATSMWVADLATTAVETAPAHHNAGSIWTEKECALYQLADTLKAELEDNMPEVEGMWADLLNAAFGEVDWQEIAENIYSEVDSYDALSGDKS